MPCVDEFAEGQKHVWGYRPTCDGHAPCYDAPYNTNTSGCRSTTPARSRASPWSSARTASCLSISGRPSPATAVRRSSRSHADFPAWPEHGSTYGRLRYRASVLQHQHARDRPGMRHGDGLPGVACDDPATGAPPVKPATHPQHSDGCQQWNGRAGHRGAVWRRGLCRLRRGCRRHRAPGGGDRHPVELVAYVTPDIDTVFSCDFRNADHPRESGHDPTSYTGFVFWGSPLIHLGGIIDNGDGNGNEKIHVEIAATRWCSGSAKLSFSYITAKSGARVPTSTCRYSPAGTGRISSSWATP